MIEGVHSAPFGARLAPYFQVPVGTVLPFGKRALRLESRAIRFRRLPYHRPRLSR